MDIRELGRLDLNLLVALEALLEERNVSRAAERLFVTQSAMSKTLGRLRELFDDPLFVRKAGGMVPTPRAEQLAQHLPAVLQAVQSMIQPMGFDPLTHEAEFTLLVQGQMGPWFMPRLLERLSRNAPNFRLRSISSAQDQFEQLANGKLDFALHAEVHRYPQDFRVTTLGFAPPVLLARKGHPLEGQAISWKSVLSYPRVQLIIPEMADIHFLTSEDSAFKLHQENFPPSLYTDQLYTAIQVVRQSDHLFPAPPLFIEQDDLGMDVIALPWPEGEEVSLKYVLINHQRISGSPVHDLLYREILGVVENFRKKYGLPTLAELRVQRNLAY